MEKASVCSICKERTHTSKNCSQLSDPLKEGFYSGGGGGGSHSHNDDDDENLLNSSSFCIRNRTFFQTLKLKYYLMV